MLAVFWKHNLGKHGEGSGCGLFANVSTKNVAKTSKDVRHGSSGYTGWLRDDMYSDSYSEKGGGWFFHSRRIV